jgi:hypothetical protein
MGYDLKPKNKEAGYFHMGAFSWSWMIDAGVGWVLGTGAGFYAGSYVFCPRADGLEIHANDGARVTAKEAKEMAFVARLLCDYQDIKRSVWDKETPENRAEMEKNYRMFSTPVRKDFVELARKFADWAEKSGGFTIH